MGGCGPVTGAGGALVSCPWGPVLAAEPASHPRCTPGGFLVPGGSRPSPPEFLPQTWWCPLPVVPVTLWNNFGSLFPFLCEGEQNL